MTPELQNQLAGVISGATNAAVKLGAFVHEQAPEVAKEIVVWNAASNWATAASLWACCIVSLVIVLSVVWWWFRKGAEDVGFWFLFAEVAFFVMLGTGHSAITHSMQAYKSTAAPRLVVIEAVAKTIK